ncbi:hypothetical protein ACVW0P_000156 [Mucilaginibacter sp. UYNi724]
MKKLLSILCVAVITLTAASCKKETVVQGGNTNQTVYATNVSNWQLIPDGGGSYVMDISVDKLDKTYSENGAVLVYIAQPGSTEWEQIPNVYAGRAYSFTHDVGRVSIYAQNPSGTGTPVKPGSIDVKIVLIDSNID